MVARVSPRVRNLLLASVALLVALPPGAAAQLIELDGRVWVPGIDAQAKIEGGSSAGTLIDFDRDLGIGTEPLPELRLSVFTGPNSLGWIWQPSLIPGVFRLGPIVEA